MSMTTLRAALAAALTGIGLLAAAPAAQATDAPAPAPASCTPQPAFGQPFASWDDFGLYTLVAGGDFEGDLAGWTVQGAAAVVEGNEPFQVGGGADRRSLALDAGESVTSAPICIDDRYPWFRLFARNTGSRRSKLRVEVLYTDTKGRLRSEGAGHYEAEHGRWEPTGNLDIDIDFREIPGGSLPVSLRFTAGAGSRWLLDDVYVDPMARG